MRKNVIYSSFDQKNMCLDFYYHGQEEQFLFSTRYRKNFHEFFRYGKSYNQLHQHRTWYRNRELRWLIEGDLIARMKQLQRKDEAICQMK